MQLKSSCLVMLKIQTTTFTSQAINVNKILLKLLDLPEWIFDFEKNLDDVEKTDRFARGSYLELKLLCGWVEDNNGNNDGDAVEVVKYWMFGGMDGWYYQ
jgi:hypothetical protein